MERLVRKSVTRTMVLKGRLLWAAVMSVLLYISPFDVLRPSQRPPYHEAIPSWTKKGEGLGLLMEFFFVVARKDSCGLGPLVGAG